MFEVQVVDDAGIFYFALVEEMLPGDIVCEVDGAGAKWYAAECYPEWDIHYIDNEDGQTLEPILNPVLVKEILDAANELWFEDAVEHYGDM